MVSVGCVASGTITPGMAVTFASTILASEVKSIELEHEELVEAEPGDNIGFNVSDKD